MKKLILLSALTWMISTTVNAQRCDKYNKYCDIELKDYDYSTQSAFAHLYPGDTVPVKTVLYIGKEYHITVCSDYGEVPWRIVQPSRKTLKEIQEIRRDTTKIYKVDEYGENIVDNNTGDYIVEKVTITVDTIWASSRVADEIPMFNSKSGTEWVQKVKTTQRAFVYVTLPIDAKPEGACVAVFIGNSQMAKSKFATKRPTGEAY